MSKWQEAVNHAAYNIVKQSADKMYDRSLLRNLADEEARKTYVFQKKSGSRSRYVDHNQKKREKLSADDREETIKLCSINLQSLTEQCENKRKEITQAGNLKNYEQCAKLHEELRSLLNEKGTVQCRLHKLQKKVKRHLRYAEKQNTIGVKESPATATKCKRDIMSFFKSKDSEQSSPNTSTCTTSNTSNDSDVTRILSSDDEDEVNVINKRKLDFHEGYTELIGDQNLVGNEVG